MNSRFLRRAPTPLEVIASRTGLPVSRLTEDMRLAEIAPDSFDRVELLLALEEECGLRLSFGAIPATEIETLGELLAALRPG